MIRWRNVHFILAASALLAAAWPALPARAQATGADQPAASSAPAANTKDPAQPGDPTDKPQPKSRGWTLVPAINNFLPSDAKTQSRFGSSWLSLGLALSAKTKNASPGRFEIHLDGAARKGTGLGAYIFPLGIGYAQRLTKPKPVAAFVGACANIYVLKLRSDFDHVDTGWRVKGGASAFVGVNLGAKINVQVSYYAIPKLSGFNLSGTNLSAHIKF